MKSDWNEMNWAPKNGLYILAYCDDKSIKIVQWQDYSSLPFGQWETVDTECKVDPVYWMPLPNKPDEGHPPAREYWEPKPDTYIHKDVYEKLECNYRELKKDYNLLKERHINRGEELSKLSRKYAQLVQYSMDNKKQLDDRTQHRDKLLKKLEEITIDRNNLKKLLNTANTRIPFFESCGCEDKTKQDRDELLKENNDLHDIIKKMNEDMDHLEWVAKDWGESNLRLMERIKRLEDVGSQMAYKYLICYKTQTSMEPDSVRLWNKVKEEK